MKWAITHTICRTAAVNAGQVWFIGHRILQLFIEIHFYFFLYEEPIQGPFYVHFPVYAAVLSDLTLRHKKDFPLFFNVVLAFGHETHGTKTTGGHQHCFVEEVAHDTRRYKWMEIKRNQPYFLFILQLHCKSPWSFKIGERLQLQVQVRLHE